MTPEETQKQLETQRGIAHIQAALDDAKALREGLEKLCAEWQASIDATGYSCTHGEDLECSCQTDVHDVTKTECLNQIKALLGKASA